MYDGTALRNWLPSLLTTNQPSSLPAIPNNVSKWAEELGIEIVIDDTVPLGQVHLIGSDGKREIIHTNIP